jgi:hypothetical protein
MKLIAETVNALGGEHSILFGAAALITALTALSSSFFGAKVSDKEVKDDCDEECRDRLRAVRTEAEGLAEQLHELRMTKHQPEGNEP